MNTVLRYLIPAVIVVAILSLAVIGPVLSYSSVEQAQFTVKEKERVCESSAEGTECRYLIFTDNGVYENTDSLLHLKFNSSDIYNNLEVGTSYQATVNWFRVPFLSMYQNILELE